MNGLFIKVNEIHDATIKFECYRLVNGLKTVIIDCIAPRKLF